MLRQLRLNIFSRATKLAIDRRLHNHSRSVSVCCLRNLNVDVTVFAVNVYVL
jgi:hypothetical protein